MYDLSEPSSDPSNEAGDQSKETILSTIDNLALMCCPTMNSINSIITTTPQLSSIAFTTRPQPHLRRASLTITSPAASRWTTR